MRDNFRLHRLIKFTQEQSFERKPALILVLKRHVHQTAGQNQRDKCWWQPKQQLCDKAVCRALRHRSGLKWTWNWPHVISARKVEFAGQHFKNDAAWEEYKIQSSPAMATISQKEQTIYSYLMQPWKLIWIHTAQHPPKHTLPHWQDLHSLKQPIRRVFCLRRYSRAVSDKEAAVVSPWY